MASFPSLQDLVKGTGSSLLYSSLVHNVLPSWAGVTLSDSGIPVTRILSCPLFFNCTLHKFDSFLLYLYFNFLHPSRILSFDFLRVRVRDAKPCRFLGHFRPEVGKLEIWELESSSQLEIRRAGDDPMNDLRLFCTLFHL